MTKQSFKHVMVSDLVATKLKKILNPADDQLLMLVTLNNVNS